MLASGSAKVLIQSDVTNIPELFLVHPDWHVAYDVDPDLASQTQDQQPEASGGGQFQPGLLFCKSQCSTTRQRGAPASPAALLFELFITAALLGNLLIRRLRFLRIGRYAFRYNYGPPRRG